MSKSTGRIQSEFVVVRAEPVSGRPFVALKVAGLEVQLRVDAALKLSDQLVDASEVADKVEFGNG